MTRPGLATMWIGARRSEGVTLIELAIVIALVGILSTMIVYFIAPVRSYIDSSRRAALADTADTALRRMGRDVRLALPNSTRVTTTGTGPSTIYYLEIMLVRTGGRYRSDATGAPNSCGASPADALSFGTAGETCFTTIGSIPNATLVAPSDYVVVYNLQPGTDKADAYQITTGPGNCGTACNKSQIAAPLPTGATQDRISFAANNFTYESPGNRFFIIEGPVSFVCNPVAGTLTRYSGYTISPTQPTSFGSGALLASGVTGCSITYDTSVTAQGAGLVTMALTLSMQDSRGSAESVSLYHAVHVNNVP